MNKKEILALLKTHGVPVCDDASEEVLVTALATLVVAGKITQKQADELNQPVSAPPPVAAIDNVIRIEDFNAMRAQLKAEREKRVKAEVATLKSEGRGFDEVKALARALNDETYIDELRSMPIIPTGLAPISTGGIGGGNSLIDDYRKLGPAPMGRDEVMEVVARGGHPPKVSFKQAKDRIAFRKRVGVENIEAQFKRHLPQAANTISSSLKPDVLIDAVVTVAVNRLAPLAAFTRKFIADVIRPGASMQVKKASAGATGQTNPSNWESGDSTLDPISITMAHKTVSFQMSQSDRNFGFDLEDIALVNAQNFANLLSDVYTAIMTVGNYGTAIIIGAAANFDPADLAPILAAAKNYRNKNLLLDGGHRAYLLPQNKFAWTFDEQERGSFGFDLIAEQNRWTGATANTQGFVNSPDAIAVGAGMPVNPESRQFDMVGSFMVDQIGLSVLYTTWYNTATRIQWASYEVMFGAGPGDTTQAEVLVTA